MEEKEPIHPERADGDLLIMRETVDLLQEISDHLYNHLQENLLSRDLEVVLRLHYRLAQHHIRLLVRWIEQEPPLEEREVIPFQPQEAPYKSEKSIVLSGLTNITRMESKYTDFVGLMEEDHHRETFQIMARQTLQIKGMYRDLIHLMD